MICTARNTIRRLAAAALLLVASGAQAYDPLDTPSAAGTERIDLTVAHSTGEREVPVCVHLPAAEGPAPVVLFSHGLGGTCEAATYLAEHWSARGYAAVFLQHPGSDGGVWRDVPRRERMAALKDAANARNFFLRARDVSAVLDQLEVWNTTPQHPLSARLDLERVGMSGHSFGARTTQAVGGQRFGRGGARFTDARVDAAVMFSPSSPRRGAPERAFGAVDIPWLLITGTEDTAPIGGTGVAARLAVYPALPPGGKYELVLDGAEHSAFTDRRLPGDQAPRDPGHHRAIQAITTAFWDTWLRRDEAARRWLDGEGPREALQPADRWQRK